MRAGKILIFVMLCALLLPMAAFGAETEVLPPRTYAFEQKAYRIYESETLYFRMENIKVNGVRCYLTKVWMKNPARQIRKVTAAWEKNVMLPRHMAEKIPEAALIINGSGFWSKKYPDVPEEYPGKVSDYYNTPWGSLTVTDGAVYRNLEGLKYCGLTLEADGLHMYTGEDNEKVLAANPTQTWCFRDLCPMQRNGEVLTPEEWPFAETKARRTVIGRMDRNNYLILSVTNEGGFGLSLYQVNDFFLENFEGLEWLYNLDGGPSSALLIRKQGSSRLKTVMGGGAKDVDIMAFTELPEE